MHDIEKILYLYIITFYKICGYETMKHKLKIVLITLIIFNMIIASFLVLDIQAFEPPKTTVQINIVDINSEALTLETIVNIQNENNFDLSIKNFEIISSTENGEEIGRILIKGGDIKAEDNKTFSSQDTFILKNENITLLKNKLTAQVSLKFFGLIQKSILNLKRLSKVLSR